MSTNASTNHVAGFSRMVAWAAFLLALVTFSAGCQLAGGMAESFERTKILDVPAVYYGLNDKRIAVMIDAPMDIQYEAPNAVPSLTELITLRISAHCKGSKLLPTRAVLGYQNQNVYWPTMDYHQLANELGVERIVMIDLIEYRLFSPGNSYYWDGRIVADINIFEAESPDSTNFGFTHRLATTFPSVEAVSRTQATQQQVEFGLQQDFSQRASWLFYDHKRKNSDLMDEARKKK